MHYFALEYFDFIRRSVRDYLFLTCFFTAGSASSVQDSQIDKMLFVEITQNLVVPVQLVSLTILVILRLTSITIICAFIIIRVNCVTFITIITITTLIIVIIAFVSVIITLLIQVWSINTFVDLTMAAILLDQNMIQSKM